MKKISIYFPGGCGNKSSKVVYVADFQKFYPIWPLFCNELRIIV